jgi:hypothetical protein
MTRQRIANDVHLGAKPIFRANSHASNCSAINKYFPASFPKGSLFPCCISIQDFPQHSREPFPNWGGAGAASASIGQEFAEGTIDNRTARCAALLSVTPLLVPPGIVGYQNGLSSFLVHTTQPHLDVKVLFVHPCQFPQSAYPSALAFLSIGSTSDCTSDS